VASVRRSYCLQGVVHGPDEVHGQSSRLTGVQLGVLSVRGLRLARLAFQNDEPAAVPDQKIEGFIQLPHPSASLS
jgi:hypothetical protein